MKTFTRKEAHRVVTTHGANWLEFVTTYGIRKEYSLALVRRWLGY
jgi:CRISPR/Cas system-associated protein Csx1